MQFIAQSPQAKLKTESFTTENSKNANGCNKQSKHAIISGNHEKIDLKNSKETELGIGENPH